MKAHLRVARPTDNLQAIAHFEDHEGFDGIMLGNPEMPYHFEFTHHRGHEAGRVPTQDNLLVFYIPDKDWWEEQCKMTEAGFKLVKSYNPYWDRNGKTFEDLDGYRVVLQNSDW